jgi:signal transduction histidine kinase
MTLSSPTGRKTGIYQLKGPIKPARGLTGSPPIMTPDGPECLNWECVRLRRQLMKKNIGLEKLSRRKSLIIDMAAHDLRGLISGILNASYYLLGEADGLPEDHLPLLRGIAASSKFTLSLIEDIVQLSQIEAGELRLALQPTDLVWLTEQNLSRNRLLADRKQIRLELIVDGALPVVRIDPLRMNQAVDNLVTTAITFSKPGSKIEVRMHAQNDVVSIAVRDEGPGITAAERRTVFKVFGRSKHAPASKTSGTGFGLVITQRIVQAHGGRIQLESQAGKGSTFTVTLPVATNARVRRIKSALISTRRLRVAAAQ